MRLINLLDQPKSFGIPAQKTDVALVPYEDSRERFKKTDEVSFFIGGLRTGCHDISAQAKALCS